MFGRQQQWLDWCTAELRPHLDAASGDDQAGLVALCFQEAWAWRCGLAWPLCRCVQWLQSATGRNLAPLGCIAQLLCIFLGWLVPSILWDTKTGPTSNCGSASTGNDAGTSRLALPHALGHHGASIKGTCKLMDSGLLILSNCPPEASGFVAHAATRGEVAWSCFPRCGGQARAPQTDSSHCPWSCV